MDRIQIDLDSNFDENKDKINQSNRKKRIHFKTLNVQLDSVPEKQLKKKCKKEIGK